MLEALIAIAVILVGGFVALLILRWVRARYFEMPEGYAAAIAWLGKHRRIVRAGPHVLLPGETLGPRLQTRPHDAILDVSDIRTHQGLPVTVRLRYRLSYVPEQMRPPELYYPSSEWRDQQGRLFMDGLQRVVEEFPKVTTDSRMGYAGLANVVGPFFSAPLFALSGKLEQRVAPRLRDLGLELARDSLVIESITLPAQVTSAFNDFVRSGFEATADARFAQTLRTAAPDLAAADLAMLHNAIINNVGQVHTVFAEGGFSPGIYLSDASNDRHSRVIAAPSPRALPARAETKANIQEPSAANEDGFPLTQEDMELLKSLRL